MVVRVLQGDCRDVLATLPDESVHMCVTSPPYWGLRDYGIEPTIWGGDADCEHVWDGAMATGQSNEQKAAAGQGQFCTLCNAWRGCLGLEPTLDLHIRHLVDIFAEVHRVLRNDGTLWLNYGDCYASSPAGTRGSHAKGDVGDGNFKRRWDALEGEDPRPDFRASRLKPKDLCMVPNRLAIALQEAGWWVRSEIVWGKANGMPESAKDRPSTSHEKIFMLSKSARYFYDYEAVKIPARYPDGPNAPAAIKSPHGQGFTRRAKRGVPPRHAQYESSDQSNLDTVGRGEGRALRNYEPAPLEVWHMATAPYPEAHFATFPPELAERCIKAGTSEKGCCSECGAPWVRKTERGELQPDHNKKSLPKQTEENGRDTRDKGWNREAGFAPNVVRSTKTTGWKPSCDCPVVYPLDRCTVLDPFGGAGTTGLVADRLGRDAVLIEAKPEYAEMTKRRIADDAGMFANIV